MGFHERKVNASHGFGGQVQALSLQCNLLAKRAQDAQDFIALGEFKLAEFVIELNDRNGFNKRVAPEALWSWMIALICPLCSARKGKTYRPERWVMRVSCSMRALAGSVR